MSGAYILYGGDEERKKEFLAHWESVHLPAYIYRYGDTKGIGIQEAREIRGKGHIVPAGGIQSFYIEKADQMTKEAANALLKFIEELPKGNFIFFLAQSLDMMLPTIVSRAFTIPFIGRSASNNKIEIPALEDIKDLENTEGVLTYLDNMLLGLRKKAHSIAGGGQNRELLPILKKIRNGLDCHANILFSPGSRKILFESYILLL